MNHQFKILHYCNLYVISELMFEILQILQLINPFSISIINRYIYIVFFTNESGVETDVHTMRVGVKCQTNELVYPFGM